MSFLFVFPVLLQFSIISNFLCGKTPAQWAFSQKSSASPKRECEGRFQQDSCLSPSINANLIGLCGFRNRKQLHANPTHSPSTGPHCVPDATGDFSDRKMGGEEKRMVSSLEKYEKSHSRPSRDFLSLLVFLWFSSLITGRQVASEEKENVQTTIKPIIQYTEQCRAYGVVLYFAKGFKMYRKGLTLLLKCNVCLLTLFSSQHFSL